MSVNYKTAGKLATVAFVSVASVACATKTGLPRTVERTLIEPVIDPFVGPFLGGAEDALNVRATTDQGKKYAILIAALTEKVKEKRERNSERAVGNTTNSSSATEELAGKATATGGEFIDNAKATGKQLFNQAKSLGERATTVTAGEAKAVLARESILVDTPLGVADIKANFPEVLSVLKTLPNDFLIGDLKDPKSWSVFEGQLKNFAQNRGRRITNNIRNRAGFVKDVFSKDNVTLLEAELKRYGCDSIEVDGDFGAKEAEALFVIGEENPSLKKFIAQVILEPNRFVRELKLLRETNDRRHVPLETCNVDGSPKLSIHWQNFRQSLVDKGCNVLVDRVPAVKDPSVISSLQDLRTQAPSAFSGLTPDSPVTQWTAVVDGLNVSCQATAVTNSVDLTDGALKSLKDKAKGLVPKL